MIWHFQGVRETEEFYNVLSAGEFTAYVPHPTKVPYFDCDLTGHSL